MGIRAKFLFYIIFPLLVVAIVATFYTSTKNFSLLRESAKKRFILDTQVIANRVSAENVRGVSVARSASTSAEIIFGNRVSSVKLMRDMLEAFPSFSGASIAYSINADFNDFRADLGLKNVKDGKDAYSDGALDSYDFSTNRTNATIEEWIAATEGGRFMAIWNKPDGDLVLSPLYESSVSAYASALKKRIEMGEKDIFVITEPSVSDGKNLIVEYVSAIMADGRYSGQVAFISDMARVQNILSSANLVGGEEYFLISPQFRVIASSKLDNLKTISINDIYLDNVGNLVRGFLREENGVLVRDELALNNIDLSKYNDFYSNILSFACNLSKNALASNSSERAISEFKDKRSGRSYYVDFATVQSGKWLVVHICPEMDFFSVATTSIVGNFVMIWAVVIIGIFGVIISARFVGRVNACRNVAEKVSAGIFDDLGPEKNADDETGRLARAMSRSIRRMAAIFQNVKNVQCELSETSKLINSALENYAFQSNLIDVQTAKISSSIKSLIENHRDVAESIERVENAFDKALENGESVRKDVLYVEELSEIFTRNVVSSMRRNSLLRERVKGIGGVSGEISKVADESNLLSLNASIEAEKSGSYGNSFEVIAREINRLSESISNSSEEMKNIAKELESSLSYDSSESNRVLENFNNFTSKFSKILLGIDVIVEHMKNAGLPTSEIAKNSVETSSEMERAVDMLAELSESVSELNALRAELISSAEGLSDKVRRIEIAISDFK